MQMLRVISSNHENDDAATFHVNSSSHQRCEIEKEDNKMIPKTTTKTRTKMVDTPPTKPQRKNKNKTKKTKKSNKLFSTMNNIKSAFLQKPQPKGDIKQEQEQQQQQQPKRCVTFYPFVKMREITHINDMDDDIIRNTYMTSDDLASIRSECIDMVHELQDEYGEVTIKEGYFLRGLDKRTYKYCEHRDQIHNELQDAVYQIQQLQKITGKDTTQLLADTCAKISQPSVVSAQMAAISDLFTSFQDTWMKRTIPTIHKTPAHGTVTLA